MWKIEHFLEVKGGEPTDLYLAVMRVMGTFLLIFSVGFLGYAIYTLVTG